MRATKISLCSIFLIVSVTTACESSGDATRGSSASVAGPPVQTARPTPPAQSAGAPAGATRAAAGSGAMPASVAAGAGSTAAPLPATDKRDARDGATGSAAAKAAASGIPCDVMRVVHQRCGQCHSDPPVGTFMALTTQAQFQAKSTTDASKKYFELAKIRVNAANNPMPPVNAGKLSSDELRALNTWLDQGAPTSIDTCDDMLGPDIKPPPDTSTMIDTSGLECHKLLAHAQGDKKAKYKVGSAVDAYINFGFQAPWQGMAYGVVVRPVVDNSQALHHWLLYREAVADGSVTATNGQHTGGELVHGWAPGGVPLDFTKYEDVGIELPSSTYSIEVHYNSSDPNALDASGAEICITQKQPKNIATLSWLGYDQGGTLSYASGVCLTPATTWEGTCRPQNTREPIHILFSTPHMHQTGRHMKAVINGPNGSRVLHDEPFDFASQIAYEKSVILMPGETITTTCTYSEPKCAGQSTSQEMCYLYTYAYPKYALTDNGPEGTFMHGQGVCLGQ